MKITIELLNEIKREFSEDYDNQLSTHNTLKKPSEVLDSLVELNYIEGEIFAIKLIEGILKDNPKTIKSWQDFVELRKYFREGDLK